MLALNSLALRENRLPLQPRKAEIYFQILVINQIG